MTDEQIKAAIAKWDKMPGAAGFWDVREALLETLRLRAEVRKWRCDAIQANKDALAAEQEAARVRADAATMQAAFRTYIRDRNALDKLESAIEALDALIGKAKE